MITMSIIKRLKANDGFTLVEVLMAAVIFPIIVAGLISAYQAVNKSYRVTRQLNEIYTVLSACPELDRALDYNILASGTNCYPNNSFINEGSSGFITTYSPTLSVTNTSSLAASDNLQAIPDSKVVEVSVGYKMDSAGTPLKLRLLITRNGVGQL
jgi:prepilin-type N-terminal cleavage/methylation domain-containing protein